VVELSAQVERNEEAFRLWRVLENLSDEERESRLSDEESDFYSHPASAMLATLVFRLLNEYAKDHGYTVEEEEEGGPVVHHEDRQVYWEKLAYRPVARVYRFYEYAKERPPEEFADLIRKFAKKYPAMRDEAA
jgi:hypothetical protein